MLSSAEGASRASTAQEEAVEEVVEAAAGLRQHAKPRYSICESIEHNTRTCPNGRQLASR